VRRVTKLIIVATNYRWNAKIAT